MKDPGKFVREHFDEAKEKGYLKVYYRPEVRSLTGRICGFEALARWEDPKVGMLSPGIFIPELEKIGRIHELDLYMIGRVCEGQRRIADAGLEITQTSVNLSRLDFGACDIFGEVDAIRQRFDLEIGYLNIEITESALSDNYQALADGMMKFREAGYQVWLDDFGSGYSSLNNLKDYAFDFLKIDMEFLRDFESKPQSRVILAAIVNMAKQLGIHTLAEGVETKEQYEFLRSIGCEKMQGFYIGKPKPLDEEILAGRKEPEDIENASDEDYYSEIGNLNVLGYYPLNVFDPTYEIMNNQALYILEVDRTGQCKYLYVNQALVKLLDKAGYEQVEDFLERLNSDEQGGMERSFRRLLRRCIESGEIETMDCVIAGKIYNFKCRHLAYDRKTGCRSYAVILTNLSDFAMLRQAENLNQVLRHLMGIYNRIDLFRADGEVENIYLESLQGRITDRISKSQEMLRNYAEEYIVPEEREAFCSFYELSTVVWRARKANKDHVTSFFHSYDEEGRMSLQMYMLIPFQLEGVMHILSCVRDIDGVEGEQPSELIKLMRVPSFDL